MTPTENTKAAPFFKFENLRIYHKAEMFSNAILAVYDQVENDTDRMVCRLMFEAASLITTNIIEGSSVSRTAFVGYLQQVKSNIRTCVYYNALLLERGVIDEAQSEDIRKELMEMTKMAGALMVSLQGENNQLQTSNC